MSAPSTRSYRPGEWYGVLGPRLTLLLPPSERARAAAAWQLVDAGAGADDVLDALLADGLRALPAFVLASTAEDGAVRLLVRGRVWVSVAAEGATVEVDGASATTWVERSWVSVGALAVVLDERSDGPELLVTDGLVRLSRLEDPAPAAGTGPVAVPLAEPDFGPEPETELGDVVDDLPPLPPLQPPPPPPHLSPPPVGPPPTAPVRVVTSDHDGETMAGGLDGSAFALVEPGIPGQPPAPLVTSRPVARLVISNGETVDVDRAVLVGRAPEARRFSPAEQPRLVTVPSPQQEISSTHLEVRPGSGADHGLAVVTDLGSTNGTVLVQPGLGPEDLQPGIAVQLVPGAVIDLGDGVTIQVTNP